ncbi:hypothetical protein AQUCO_03200052v1 [Aquilegia coerulea]|uniref:Uncharacterized protein n=1 Tax=Aquilegia coerulea TaxID=218851 RepID=A0A2G5CZY5_AQUCA|nr:hypothetical protein AQUCO_03200052v1 [Aquilegia coerulea]
MVTTFGMHDIGPWNRIDSSAQSGYMIIRTPETQCQKGLAEDISSKWGYDHEWCHKLMLERLVGLMLLLNNCEALHIQLTDSAYKIALSHIKNNCEAMDKIVEILLKETITGDEFRAILCEWLPK